MSVVSVVDTNVILRFFLGDHREYSEKAILFFDQVRSGQQRAFIPEAIWAECYFLMTKTYGITRHETLDKLEKLSTLGGVDGDHGAILRRSFKLLRRHNIAFADALAYAHAEEQGWNLMTFDKKLRRLFDGRMA